MNTWITASDRFGGRVVLGVLLVWIFAAVTFIAAVTPVADQATPIEDFTICVDVSP